MRIIFLKHFISVNISIQDSYDMITKYIKGNLKPTAVLHCSSEIWVEMIHLCVNIFFSYWLLTWTKMIYGQANECSICGSTHILCKSMYCVQIYHSIVLLLFQMQKFHFPYIFNDKKKTNHVDNNQISEQKLTT